VSGVSIADLVDVVDSELNATMLTLLESVETAVHSVSVPFDQAIILPDTREQVFDTVIALLDAGDEIVVVADALGLTIDTAIPE
jgi:hypothetical protein